jgi:uncharacterized membrane protein
VPIRPILVILGVLCVAMGVLWIGQGLGWIRWPASSFMIDERPWAFRGGMLLAVGVVLIYLTRRR